MTIVACTLATIVVHAVLPAKVDEALLDGVLVLRFGFPAVAVAYFLILFPHCSATVVASWPTARYGPRRHGLVVGLAFAVMYVIGMQEIMVDTSPFSAWGSDFVIYQTIMGLGDAVPVIVLCAVVGALLAGRPRVGASPHGGGVVLLVVTTLLIGTVRLGLSISGVIHSGIADYPAAVVAWGYLLGLGFGFAAVLLARANRACRTVMVFGVGVNWIIFNSFIGLVFGGTMGDALLRSVIDVAALSVSLLLADKVARLRRPHAARATLRPRGPIIRTERSDDGSGAAPAPSTIDSEVTQ